MIPHEKKMEIAGTVMDGDKTTTTGLEIHEKEKNVLSKLE